MGQIQHVDISFKMCFCVTGVFLCLLFLLLFIFLAQIDTNTKYYFFIFNKVHAMIKQLNYFSKPSVTLLSLTAIF